VAGSRGSAVSGTGRASSNDPAAVADADQTTRSAEGALTAWAIHEASSAAPVPGAAAADAEPPSSSPIFIPT